MFIKTPLFIIYGYYFALYMDEVINNLWNFADLINLDIMSDMIKNEGDMIKFFWLSS